MSMKKTNQERVLEMKGANDKTGDGQAKEILELVKAKMISTDALVLHSYDYAASMSGSFQGAQRCLQDILGRRIPYVPCHGH